MIRHRVGSYFILMVTGCFLLGASVDGALKTESLFSQNTAEQFARQARAFYEQTPADPQVIEQAMTFLDASLALDKASAPVPDQILRIGAAGRYGNIDYSESIHWALARQVDSRADLVVLNGAVASLLEQQNSRLDREVLLEKLLKKYAQQNPAFGSDLATQLGLLAVEKADMETAMSRLSYAYDLNPYNQLAYAKLQELSEVQGLSITPSTYMVGLRTALDINPYDLAIAVEYADVLKRLGLYGTAAAAYDYAAQLYAFYHPGEPLDEAIFLPWILCCYHTPRHAATTLEVIERYRGVSRFDLMAEAVAGKMYLKLRQVEKGNTRLVEAGKKAETLLREKGSRQIYPEQLAWFYSFVLEQPEKALAWANRAYKEAADRQGVTEIFAYTLAQSGQGELAKEYAEPREETSQTASLALAVVAVAERDKTRAISLLKSAITMSPESFVAEKALQLLREQDSDYIPSAESATVEQDLEKAYPKRLVPQFLTPDKRFNAKLVFSGSEFSYGTDLSPKLVIENTSSASLVIAPGGMLQGRLQVDAVLTGDLNVTIDNVLSMAFRPSRPIAPGEHVSVPLPTDTGKLRRILLTYPQAGVDVKFTAYLDPVADEAGNVQSGLQGFEPITETVKRPGVSLTREFLMQRLDALSKGRPGQQFRAIRLFAGLLAEQKAFAISGADFRYVQVDQTLLADSIRRALKDQSWKVRVEAMDALLTLSVPLDTTLVTDISQNLGHDKWPVRLMAMVLLAKAQPETFGQVLDWTAQQDAHWLNRRMALALGATPKTPEQKPEAAENSAITGG